MIHARIIMLVLIASLMLCGCSDTDSADLRAWIERTRATAVAEPEPLPPVQTIEPFRYDRQRREDPFDMTRLAAALPGEEAAGGPDMRRAREPLEAYPLDLLHMVGSLRRGRQIMALIEADKRIYLVAPGQYLGQDLGRVLTISEDALELEERVQDANGHWRIRRARLTLRENL